MSASFQIDNFEEYLDVVRNELPKVRKYYRGQYKVATDGYELKPSIGRYAHLKELSLFELEKLERDALGIFDNHLLTYLQHLPRNEWEVLAIAQHHGLPTRFMDWTANPLVALYFSSRETKIDEKGVPQNGAVYVLISEPRRYSDLMRKQEPEIKPIGDLLTKLTELNKFSEFLKPESTEGIDFIDDENENEKKSEAEKSVTSIKSIDMPSPFEIKENIIYDPPHVSPRIRAQDGVLLACHQPLMCLEENDYIEIIIKHQAQDDIRRRLNQYGVFDKQLFPDLDGIAKWLKYCAFEIREEI